MNQLKMLLLDRDGVINHDPGDYTASLSEFHILPGVIERLKEWSDQGYSIAIVTNQGGIAKKRYTLADFLEIDKFMSDQFRKAGINFLKTYYCPHHESVSRCLCRKPRGGMVEKALAEFGGDKALSLMIGDKPRDIDAATEAGIKGILVNVNQDLRSIELT